MPLRTPLISLTLSITTSSSQLIWYLDSSDQLNIFSTTAVASSDSCKCARRHGHLCDTHCVHSHGHSSSFIDWAMTCKLSARVHCSRWSGDAITHRKNSGVSLALLLSALKNFFRLAAAL
eukprot:Blabericola_migrator_1__4875@NODE_254_length_10809_cov_136_023925_g213_i0_p8_GENE_NODE_254_length_10809_cov_136_023925_g213_i0NODE_254_length_10809_cov_136_023925_g213_i0_p8_ORF_typecomplete_len120_score10_28RdRP_2/PF00978_21/0_014_NODE_254_length_10809_cov_136_023925_g213_i0989310252